jgi:DNA (cytosine-5)-methyltransferase 1
VAQSPEIGRGGRRHGDSTRYSGQVQAEGRSASGELANDIDAGSQGWLCGRPDEGRQDQYGHTGRYGTTGFWADADWIDCKDGKTRPVEPSTFPLAYGATARVGRLRAYGNAIVPQAAQALIGAYLAT